MRLRLCEDGDGIGTAEAARDRIPRIHHAGEQADGVPVDAVDRLFLVEHADQDHHAGADHRDDRAVGLLRHDGGVARLPERTRKPTSRSDRNEHVMPQPRSLPTSPQVQAARPDGPSAPVVLRAKSGRRGRESSSAFSKDAGSRIIGRRARVVPHNREVIRGCQCPFQQSENLGQAARLHLCGRGDRAEPADLHRRTARSRPGQQAGRRRPAIFARRRSKRSRISSFALEGAGAGFKDVVKINNYLTDMSHIGIFREVRDEFVNTAAPPASDHRGHFATGAAGRVVRDRGDRGAAGEGGSQAEQARKSAAKKASKAKKKKR